MADSCRGTTKTATSEGRATRSTQSRESRTKSTWCLEGDYARVIAEFWADGPDSETPPGHWYTLLNEFILDGQAGQHRWRGQGPLIDDLQFDVKSYLALGGAMHDCAIAAWSAKGYYDYSRPVSAIRYMAEHGKVQTPTCPITTRRVCRSFRVGLRWWTTRIP